MNMNRRFTWRVASALLLSVVLASCASNQPVSSPELLQRIESARTRGDYEALATYYDQQAAAARGIATQHRKMATSYQGMIAGGRGGASMPAHCNAIAGKNEAVAGDYEAMAAAYRELAMRAQP